MAMADNSPDQFSYDKLSSLLQINFIKQFKFLWKINHAII